MRRVRVRLAAQAAVVGGGGGGSSGGGGSGGGGGTSIYGGAPSCGGPPAGSVPSPASPAPPPCKSWTCKFKKFAGDIGGFVSKHRATIASVAVGVGCGLAVGWTGAGGVACAAAAGAVYGVVNHAQHTPGTSGRWAASSKPAPKAQP